jgi:hypothetical protein
MQAYSSTPQLISAASQNTSRNFKWQSHVPPTRLDIAVGQTSWLIPGPELSARAIAYPGS